MRRRDLLTLLALAPLGAVAACDGSADDTGKPSIVVTTNILGDVVTQVVGDQASVTTLMAPNADPHSFGISAKQTLAMRDAALLVTNGLGLEEGLASNIESAKGDGVTLFTAGEQLTPIEYSSDDASGPDPHFWTDPTRMIDVVNGLEGALGKVPGIDASALAASATAYRDKLAAADKDMSTRFSAIPQDKRALVTNHHVFGYMAARYGFRLIGAVIPGGSTLAAPSASDLEELLHGRARRRRERDLRRHLALRPAHHRPQGVRRAGHPGGVPVHRVPLSPRRRGAHLPGHARRQHRPHHHGPHRVRTDHRR